MTYTYDLADSIGKTRLWATDTNISDAVYSDEELQVFLDACGDAPMLAAAAALENMGTDAAKLAIKTRQDTISTDPTEIPVQLREQAARLREQHAAQGAGTLTLVDPPDKIFELPKDPEIGNLNPW